MINIRRFRHAWRCGPRARRLMVASAWPLAWHVVAAHDGQHLRAAIWRLVSRACDALARRAYGPADRLGTRLDRIGHLIDRLVRRAGP